MSLSMSCVKLVSVPKEDDNDPSRLQHVNTGRQTHKTGKWLSIRVSKFILTCQGTIFCRFILYHNTQHDTEEMAQIPVPTNDTVFIPS